MVFYLLRRTRVVNIIISSASFTPATTGSILTIMYVLVLSPCSHGKYLRHKTSTLLPQCCANIRHWPDSQDKPRSKKADDMKHHCRHWTWSARTHFALLVRSTWEVGDQTTCVFQKDGSRYGDNRLYRHFPVCLRFSIPLLRAQRGVLTSVWTYRVDGNVNTDVVHRGVEYRVSTFLNYLDK